MQRQNNKVNTDSYIDLKSKIRKAYQLTRHLKAVTQ